MKQDQPRTEKGQFGQKPAGVERRGEAIALRLPASLDAQVRAAAGWQSAADNIVLRDWVEGACQEKVRGEGRGERGKDDPDSSHLTPHTSPSYSVAQIRAAADRVAMTIQPRERLRVQKAFKALLGELLANGD